MWGPNNYHTVIMGINIGKGRPKYTGLMIHHSYFYAFRDFPQIAVIKNYPPLILGAKLKIEIPSSQNQDNNILSRLRRGIFYLTSLFYSNVNRVPERESKTQPPQKQIVKIFTLLHNIHIDRQRKFVIKYGRKQRLQFIEGENVKTCMPLYEV